jgi:hypothetical protein
MTCKRPSATLAMLVVPAAHWDGCSARGAQVHWHGESDGLDPIARRQFSNVEVDPTKIEAPRNEVPDEVGAGATYMRQMSSVLRLS